MYMASKGLTAEVLCALLLFAGTDVDAQASSKKASRADAGSKKVAKATPIALHLRSIDLLRRLALVEVAGLARPPAGNLFTFVDERDRHFVAMGVRCEDLPSGSRQCELDLPAGYERHRLVSLTLHLHGLHSGTVAVDAEEVEDAWSKAETEAQNTPTRVPAAVPATPMATRPKCSAANKDEKKEKEVRPPSPSKPSTEEETEEEEEEEPDEEREVRR